MTAPAPVASSLMTRMAVGASIAVHLVAVLLSLSYAGAGLFEASEAEAVSVSLVTPEDVAAAKPEPTPAPEQKPEPDLSKLDLRLSPIESPPQQPQQQAPGEKLQSAKSAPQSPRQQQVTLASQPAPPAYTAPQPDISMKYGVDLGLKTFAAAPSASAQDGASDFDAPAMSKADIDKSSIAAFRARLKQCAALPSQIGPDDKVVIVLRATFTPEAKLAAPPVLIEASASAKGPALMQAAIAALESCQPYSALPPDKYAEWRVLDLRFTPQDFRKG